MKQLGFLVHIEKCLGCRSCEFSCKNEYGHEDSFRRKIHSIKSESDRNGHSFHHFSLACNHCENPACMAMCPESCIKKIPNGIVIINKEKCSGCGICVAACPFTAIKIDPFTRKADKCDMCYERQRLGQSPTCIEACPVKAIEIIDIHDEKNQQYNKEVYGLHLKNLTNPSIRFNEKKEKALHFWSI